MFDILHTFLVVTDSLCSEYLLDPSFNENTVVPSIQTSAPSFPLLLRTVNV